MFNTGYILAPQAIAVGFDTCPVCNALESLRELGEVERLSGFADWVTATAAALPPDLAFTNRMVFDALGFAIEESLKPVPAWADFPAYLRDLAGMDAVWLRDRALERLAALPSTYKELGERFIGSSVPVNPVPADLLASLELYTAFSDVLWPECQGDPTYVTGHALLNDPPAMLRTMVEHLDTMWRRVMADEWQRVEPMIRESVDAFSRLDYSGLTPYEVIRAVTGRDLRGRLDEKLDVIDRLVFVPSAHIGPYVGKFLLGSTLYMTFGVRLPREAQDATPAAAALTRSELLVRLNALADDTRLRILELLTQHEELCAQDFIERLELSQSSVSRHLSQLSATGYIVERRRDAAKCYMLNTDRVVDTVRALTHLLSRK